MHKVFLTLLLAAMASSAMAEWIEISVNGGMTTFANTNIKKFGSFVVAWRLYDFPKAHLDSDGESYQSIKSLSEYDCRADRSRLIYVANFARKGGLGSRISSEIHLPSINRTWVPVAPRSIDEAAMKIACGQSARAQRSGDNEIWVDVGTSETMTTYVDPSTITITANGMTMLDLADFVAPTKSKAANDEPFMSVKTEVEYDCDQKRTRPLSLSMHSGPMGGNSTLARIPDPGQWVPVTSKTRQEILWNIVCSKR